MAMSQAAEVRPRPDRHRLRLGAWLVAAVAGALLLGGYGGYALSQHRNAVHVLTGKAYVEIHQAGITVGDWTYGFSDSVPEWIDASGTTHMGGWPNCLNRVGTHQRIRFGWIPVTFPNGIGERDVVWVDCRG